MFIFFLLLLSIVILTAIPSWSYQARWPSSASATSNWTQLFLSFFFNKNWVQNHFLLFGRSKNKNFVSQFYGLIFIWFFSLFKSNLKPYPVVQTQYVEKKVAVPQPYPVHVDRPVVSIFVFLFSNLSILICSFVRELNIYSKTYRSCERTKIISNLYNRASVFENKFLFCASKK